jgi:prepilin-type processing-associated H-X9-DG protein/prepilin-type N-terminal cleavage/methylation domain-containing protein
MKQNRRGFSLVELLVVIGIVALLIALLLPSLARAREKANEAQCLANLHQIGLAAAMHVSEHQQHLPAAGWHFDPVGGLLDPAGLEDRDERKFDYYMDEGIKRPVPVTVAFGMLLGVDIETSSRANLERDMAGSALRRRFACPSQVEVLRGLSQRDGATGWTAPRDYSSYIFNEALLGRRPGTDLQQVVGHTSRMTHTSDLMQAMDGRPRNMTNDNWIMVFNSHPDDTLFDFMTTTMKPNNGFGKQTLDRWRHRGRANVLYVDGHSESILLDDGGLKSVWISRGLH